MDDKEIETRFTHHPPSSQQLDTYTRIRDQAKALALYIVYNTPESREQSLAITYLEQVVMWANAGVARRT
jgi:hypothetical protein